MLDSYVAVNRPTLSVIIYENNIRDNGGNVRLSGTFLCFTVNATDCGRRLIRSITGYRPIDELLLFVTDYFVSFLYNYQIKRKNSEQMLLKIKIKCRFIFENKINIWDIKIKNNCVMLLRRSWSQNIVPPAAVLNLSLNVREEGIRTPLDDETKPCFAPKNVTTRTRVIFPAWTREHEKN